MKGKMPGRPIDRSLPPLFGAVLHPIQAFFRLEAASGILLVASAIVALALANSPLAAFYRSFCEYPLGFRVGGWNASFSLLALVNEGLMTLFFFVVGMEIKRELVLGELRTPARALLPGIAAIGGMALPAAIYLALNFGKPGQSGWAIPVATDIAFSIGCLTLLRTRVPHALVVFITALAIFDDIGGILVIALFYGKGLALPWLALAAAVAVVLAIGGIAYVRVASIYAILGGTLWFAFHHAGIHATMAGVVLGLAIPSRARRAAQEVFGELSTHIERLREKPSEEDVGAADLLMIEENIEALEAPANRFIHALHPIVAFVIMPLFAFVNSGVSVRGMGPADLLSPVTLGCVLGLFVGKQVGIFLLTLATVRIGWAPMPGETSATKLYGASIIAGIGFTVSLFIAALAFAPDSPLLGQAKLGILLGSFASGAAGLLWLGLTRRMER